MTEWSKVLRSGRSVFARVGSNPTVCIFLFSFWWEEWSKSVWLCVNGVDMCCFLMFLFLWSVSVYQFVFLSPAQPSTHRTPCAPYWMMRLNSFWRIIASKQGLNFPAQYYPLQLSFSRRMGVSSIVSLFMCFSFSVSFRTASISLAARTLLLRIAGVSLWGTLDICPWIVSHCFKCLQTVFFE